MGTRAQPLLTICFLIGQLLPGMSAAATGTDPATEPLPDFNTVLNDTRRALVVETLLDSGSAQFQKGFVSNRPPRAHISDPPLMLVEWFDADDTLIGSRTAWDPRWEFRRDDNGGEYRVILPQAVGSFDIPFTSDIVTVAVTDLQTDNELLTVDVRHVVQEFCINNSEDPNCAGFSANQPPGIKAIVSQTVMVGETLEVIPEVSDPENDKYTLTWEGIPENAIANGIFSFRPEAEQVGDTYEVTVTASQYGMPSLSDSETFAVSVLPAIESSTPESEKGGGGGWGILSFLILALVFILQGMMRIDTSFR